MLIEARNYFSCLHPMLVRCFAVAFGVWVAIISLYAMKRSTVNVALHKSVPVQLLQNGKVTKVTLTPINGIIQHTDFIGTSDRPTLDGGIINAADGITINVIHVDTNTQKSSTDLPMNFINKKMQRNSPTKLTSENPEHKTLLKLARPFQDTWATSSKVKSLLEEAAKDGKLDYVLRKTNQKGLPASVATVPMIESRYQVDAVSPKGAAGAWQLMSATAKDYGVNKEDRYKFKPATDAALNLLDDLHKQFGSWELAFAAYNAGAERVQTALRKKPHAHSVRELDLPVETKNYVALIMALNKTMESL